jgi:hypothetical protein
MSTTPPPLPLVEKPTALTVFGVLNIIFGTLGLIGGAMSVKLYFTPLDGQTGLMPDLLRAVPFYADCIRKMLIPGAVFSLLNLGSGIGLLRSNERARRIALACAIYGLAAGLLVGWLNIRYVMPFMLEHSLAQVKEPAVAEITRSVTLASTYVGAALGLLYPVLTLVFLSRAKVRQYCTPRVHADNPL